MALGIVDPPFPFATGGWNVLAFLGGGGEAEREEGDDEMQMIELSSPFSVAVGKTGSVFARRTTLGRCCLVGACRATRPFVASVSSGTVGSERAARLAFGRQGSASSSEEMTRAAISSGFVVCLLPAVVSCPEPFLREVLSTAISVMGTSCSCGP